MVRNLTIVLAGLLGLGTAATALADNDLLRLDGKGDARIDEARVVVRAGYRGFYGYRGGYAYRGGFSRGYYGFYRPYYRPGISIGLYGAPYYSGYYYAPSYYYSPPPVYYYAPPVVLSSAAPAPCDACDAGIVAPPAYVAPQPQSVRAPIVRQPNAPTAVSQPGNRPTYNYDGGPRSVVPTPGPAPMTIPAAPAPTDGRLVSNTAAPRYLAYGETAETPARTTPIVAQPSGSDSNDLMPIAYRIRSASSFEGGTMLYTQTGVR